jgi:deoxyribonuclease-4
VLIETTAGQGTGVGSRFEDLGAIIAASRKPDRLGICYDTAHTFAAGYDLIDPAAYAATMQALDAAVGISRVKFFHLNDSKVPFGSGKDRHEHIGKGHIGLQGFANLLNDPRFAEIPMVLETPKEPEKVPAKSGKPKLPKLSGKALEEQRQALDRANLKQLRSLLAK